MAAKEILGLRDWRLSDRHRLYGPCYMSDIDFLVAEYTNCQPKALVEYKHCNFSAVNTLLDNPGVRVVQSLADRASLPAWTAIYDPDSWVFKVFAVNAAARAIIGSQVYFTEVEYVCLLHQIRGATPGPEILAALNSTTNPIEPDGTD